MADEEAAVRGVVILGLSLGDATPRPNIAWSEVWGLNSMHRAPWAKTLLEAKRFSKWFQLHPPDGCDAGELEWMELLNAGVYAIPTIVAETSLETWKHRYPLAAAKGLLIPFPLEEVLKRFPRGVAPYANTFCLEIALALCLGVTELALVGIECTTYGRELVVERPAIMWWMGVLQALGISLHQPAQSTLRYKEIYGLEYWDEARRAAEITDLILPRTKDTDIVNFDSVAAVDAARKGDTL